MTKAGTGSETFEAWANLHRVYLEMRRLLDAEMASNASCSLFEHDLLSRLDFAEGHRLKMNELADLMDVTRGGLTRIIDRLVERDWVRRDRPDDNRREVYAVLTDEGERTLAKARVTYVRLLEETLGGQLTGPELSDFVGSTDKLLKALGRPC
ncbi:MarR family winged helix-turn-helix transcriptional regulator [Tenggerimyces flavus]|uniref:MarR family winged helix-turn-helix transcriptional regulator n=1 Tax=Tenggerimyces flavus TaxID=1708749 RepID=A0ABV7YBP5_9ACTN|nr:MarR family transcriptional regulator [Tenggerimyces flavus]MBM7783477.1 DNA-binding MarR family transcriptional regulator [Tenggerimyces flavus]